MNYYRRYSGDYLRDTARLTLAEHGAYCLLLDYYYSEETPLPADRMECYILVRAVRPEDQAAVDKVLDTYFELRADGYHQVRVDGEIDKAQKARAAAQENGKKGGRPAGRNNPAKTQPGTQEVMQSDKSGNPEKTQGVSKTAEKQNPAEKPLQPPTSNHQPPAAKHQPPAHGTPPIEGGVGTEVGVVSVLRAGGGNG